MDPAKTVASTDFEYYWVDSGVPATGLSNWHSLLTNHSSKSVDFANCYVSVN